MDKNKIISDICPFYKEYGSCAKCDKELDTDDEPCYYKCVANVIISNGYCKASDLEAEIEDLKAIAEQYQKQFEDARADVARDVIAEIDNALHDMAVEYEKAGHPEYFAVCEMVYHKVIRRVEKKYEVTNNESK